MQVEDPSTLIKPAPYSAQGLLFGGLGLATSIDDGFFALRGSAAMA
jgi:hypothetical protein